MSYGRTLLKKFPTTFLIVVSHLLGVILIYKNLPPEVIFPIEKMIILRIPTGRKGLRTGI